MCACVRVIGAVGLKAYSRLWVLKRILGKENLLVGQSNVQEDGWHICVWCVCMGLSPGEVVAPHLWSEVVTHMSPGAGQPCGNRL